MSSLPDAERDACDVVRALDGLVALLGGADQARAEQDHPIAADQADCDDMRQVLQALAADGGAAAVRVLAYLRTLRGPGDGAAAVLPPRLGPWREWVPPRGHLLGDTREPRRVGELRHPRRCDPGE